MRKYGVRIKTTGQNGMDYGIAFQWVTAPDEATAKIDADRIVKGQGGPTAHITEFVSIQDFGEVPLCECCGQYHD